MNTKDTISESSNSDEISIKELLIKTKEWYRYILSKWLIILCFGILGGIIGFAYATVNKPVYTATTTFVLESGESGGGLGQYAGIASMVGLDVGGGNGGIFQSENIVELYKSRKMIENALLSKIEYDGKQHLVIDRFIEFNELKKDWAKDPHLNSLTFEADSKDSLLNFTRLQDSILSVISDDIRNNYLGVIKDKKSSIIQVDVKSKDEFFSKIFNDQIVKNVNDFYVQTKTKKSVDNINILKDKTDSVRSVMNGAIYEAAKVSDATPNLNPTRQVQRIAPMQRSQFNAETNKAILNELVKNLELSKMSLLRETPLIQVIDHPIFPLNKQKVGKAKGILIGGIAAGFLIIFILIFRKFMREVLAH